MVTALDLSLFNFIYSIAGISGFTDGLIIFFAKYLPYLIVLGVAWLLYRTKEFKTRFYLFAHLALVTLLSRGLITEVIRFFYDRQRPFAVLGFDPLFTHEAGGAMPSGHAAFFFGIAFSILVLYSRKVGMGKQNIGWWYVGAAILMGFCRIAAGVHWPLDVIAGASIALVGAWAVDWLLEKVFVRTAAA